MNKKLSDLYIGLNSTEFRTQELLIKAIEQVCKESALSPNLDKFTNAEIAQAIIIGLEDLDQDLSMQQLETRIQDERSFR